MWAKTTPGHEENGPDIRLNEPRSTDLRHSEHHLGVPAIKQTFIHLMQRLCLNEWQPGLRNYDVSCRFIRVS